MTAETSRGMPIVLPRDHIIEQDYLATKPRSNLRYESDLAIYRSSDIGVDESIDSANELQVGVPCEFDVLHIYLDSLNDELLSIDSIIDVNLIFLLSTTLPCIGPRTLVSMNLR